MKTVSTVAAQAMTKVRDGDFIEADTEISVQAQHDQERATGKVINQLFRQLRSIRTAWRQAWPDKKAYMESKATWLQAFIENGICTQEQIDIGLIRCRAEPSDFIPSVGKFIQGCVPSPEMLKPPLPSVEAAYKQALRNCHPTMHGVAKWFHPAVYHATAAAGFNSLPLLSRELGLISFEKRYLEQVRKVWMGELLAPVPVAELAAPSERTPEVGNQALAELRAMRGEVLPVPDPRLAPTDPADYRFAVHCCAHKLDLTDKPDRAVALFEHQVLALKFGQAMWPEHFEVIDVITGERVCA